MNAPSQLTLFYAPGACSRVSLIALEETGAPFDSRVVAFMAGEHKSQEYLAMNPAGKVPLLLTNGRPVSQNLAILIFLAQSFPDAGLMPFTGQPFDDAQALSLLNWCASDLHPLVTRLRLPDFYCDLPGAPERVWQMAEPAMRAQLATAEARLARTEWMLGDQWSAVDAYLYWVWFRISGAGFSGHGFANIIAHAKRMEDRPAVQAALAREAVGEAELEARGLLFRPPTFSDR